MSELVARLAAAGFVAAEDEAAELRAAARDAGELEELVARRLTGEPLAWITGSVEFCGLSVAVAPGVYVPRWHSEVVARRALSRLPADGVAVDVCCGSGAIAAVLSRDRPGARVLACDSDPVAVACARANGVEAVGGDLLAPVPAALAGRVDVVVGVVPYVPSGELGLLQRDTFTFETPLAYDGGTDGLRLARRVIAEAAPLLWPGGALVLELGGDQPAAVAPDLAAAGYSPADVLYDEEGDVRGIEALR